MVSHLPNVPGDSIFPYLDLDSEIIESSITPNRADALSMRGVAHEVYCNYAENLFTSRKTVTEDSKPASDSFSSHRK